MLTRTYKETKYMLCILITKGYHYEIRGKKTNGIMTPAIF